MGKLLPLLLPLFVLQHVSAQNFPVANNDTFTINKNNLISLPVLSNDFDADGDSLTVSVLVLPANGTVTVSANQIKYLTNLNYVGKDSLKYVICDSTNRCDTAIVLIIINAANNRPTAINDTFSINKNNQTTLPVLSNDYDVDGDSLTLTILIPPANGTATVSNNQIVYLPNLNFSGVDSITYIICDTINSCDTALVLIIIGNADNRPVAVNDSFTVPETLQSTLPVLSNDYDPDGGVLTITILNPPSHGNATANGTEVNYTPSQFYFGTDSFVYIICDSSNLCDTATVYIVINGSNLPPVAVDDNFSFGDTLNTTFLNILANDYDPENNSFSVVSVADINSAVNPGSLTVDSATGNLIFVRNGITCGSETFEYVICDYSMCDTGTVTITIACAENIFLTEGFSPDGDGMNDKLVFKRLEYFAPAALKVFNRYGTMVYNSDDYKNDWDGTYLESGKGLPDGTYFYILELTDKRKYNNYLIINR